MTECSSESMSFSSVSRHEIVADFLGGRLTSDAGGLLLKEVDRRIGLLDAINAEIPDPRDPISTVHEQRTMLAQRIFSIALGYEDLNDQQTMRTDAALQIASGVAPVEEQPMASLSTFAYVLMDALRRDYLKGTELEAAQCSTIRLKLFKIAARVRVTVRRVWLHLSSCYPYQALFQTLSSRLLPDSG